MAKPKNPGSKLKVIKNTESNSQNHSSGADIDGSKKKPSKKNTAEVPNLRLLERRKHPRFLLSREQFRDVRGGRIFPVYDLSMNGLSIRIDERYWKVGEIIQGILNLHPDSIELAPRMVGYYGDRAALKLEVISTYARGILGRALSPQRLGQSLQLVREKLPLADYWYHGVCNTDLLLRLNHAGEIAKAEVFFSNYYWSWTEHSGKFETGVCQSFGKEDREELLLADEPVKMEGVDVCRDADHDTEKMRWAKGIVECAPLQPKHKELLLKKFENF